MSFVEHNGKIVPAFLFEPLDDRKPDCFVCNDTGLVRETIDEERLDVMFPCWRCQQRKAESEAELCAAILLAIGLGAVSNEKQKARQGSDLGQ